MSGQLIIKIIPMNLLNCKFLLFFLLHIQFDKFKVKFKFNLFYDRSNSERKENKKNYNNKRINSIIICF